MIISFKDLEVYKEAYDLAIIVNKNVNKLPLFEKNDLGSQLRRASKSVPSNIAEGWAKRQFEKQFKLHLNSSIGSCNEMEGKLLIFKKTGRHTKSTFSLLFSKFYFLCSIFYCQAEGQVVIFINHLAMVL